MAGSGSNSSIRKEPALESEANSRFNIRPVPFQPSKHQASVTNSYFNILVQYGDEFQTLGFRDLIEVKQAGDTNLDVNLRDPEYEITRAIKKVIDSYRGSATSSAAFGARAARGLVSADDKLPESLCPRTARRARGADRRLQAAPAAANSTRNCRSG